MQYDKDYVNFICPRCGRKYTFGEIRRKVTRKAQAEEIGDISQIGYNIHAETEELPINPKFTVDDKKKKEKVLTANEIEILKHKAELKEKQRIRDMIDYPEIYNQFVDEDQFD